MEQQLRNRFLIRRTILSLNHVYQFQVTLASTVGDILLDTNYPRCITFQFIFQEGFLTIDKYLIAFDLDVVQLCYDGDRVLSTWAAINALSSGTFLCYCLSRDINKLGRAALRLSKYIRRGFTFLYPHQFPMAQFLTLDSGSCNNPSFRDHSSINYQFGQNNDYFDVQKQFVRFFLDRSFT